MHCRICCKEKKQCPLEAICCSESPPSPVCGEEEKTPSVQIGSHCTNCHHQGLPHHPVLVSWSASAESCRNKVKIVSHLWPLYFAWQFSSQYSHVFSHLNQTDDVRRLMQWIGKHCVRLICVSLFCCCCRCLSLTVRVCFVVLSSTVRMCFVVERTCVFCCFVADCSYVFLLFCHRLFVCVLLFCRRCFRRNVAAADTATASHAPSKPNSSILSF